MKAERITAGRSSGIPPQTQKTEELWQLGWLESTTCESRGHLQMLTSKE